MMDVREQALAAHWAAQEAANEALEQEREADRRKAEEAEYKVRALALDSVLHEWFPAVEWEVYATRENDAFQSMTGTTRTQGSKGLLGIVCTDRPPGTDPEWAGVPCFGISAAEATDSGPPEDGARDRPRVFYCHTSHADGYTDWGGVEVRSLEHLGKLIASHEAATNELLQKEAREACRCFKAGSNPATAEDLRCQHRAKHAAMLRAADASSSRAQYSERMRAWRTSREGGADQDREDGAVELDLRMQVRAAEREGWAQVPVALTLAGEATAARPLLEGKDCPESGGRCQHQAECEGSSTISCWLRHARIANEPEGRTTGLHRDSMG